MILLRVSIVVLTLLASACAKTTVIVKSNPPGAQAIFSHTGITAITDQKLILQSGFFDKGSKIRDEIVIFEKDGFRSKHLNYQLVKNKDNFITTDLSELDTQIDIKSTPATVHLEFISKKGRGNISVVEYPSDEKELEAMKADKSLFILPEGWPKKFTTPIHLECTQQEIQQISDTLRLKMQGDTGYVPTGEYWKMASQGIDLNLKKNFSNQINISLKPVVTTLQVVSTPPGAIVEDISSGGFGYIGETPVIRNFNWEDVVQWSEKRKYKEFEAGSKERKKTENNMLYLDLRISKAGHEDSFLRGLRLPIGEERSFHKNLKQRISSINFASDPAGVHVYVERENIKEIFDTATKNFSEIPVIHKKHLGTTPFTLNMDPNDPLQHGEKLLFEKTGYIAGEMQFSEGNDSYYEVMSPMEVKKR